MAFLCYPTTLFENHEFEYEIIYMIEDPKYFTYYKYHKQKLVMHRATMRYYYDNCSSNNKRYINCNNVDYHIIFRKHKHIIVYDLVDHDMNSKIQELSKEYGTKLEVIPTKLFMNEDIDEYYNSVKSHMKYLHDSGFYRWQRYKTGILMNGNKPIYGKLSFDKNNRNPFDRDYTEPKWIIDDNNDRDKYVNEAKKYVMKQWGSNFGDIDIFIHPITHREAKKVVSDFIRNKLDEFGKYQDAVNTEVIIGNHSMLSSCLNIGLITVEYILQKLAKLEITKKNISTIEGFIRQLIGWRSYMRFIYKYHYNDIIGDNILDNNERLTWFEKSTGIYPIDTLIEKVRKFAYLHHIERLMYIGNFGLLSGIHPLEMYKWFMICFIDSYDWVMLGNVMCMSQYASKITITTRPYFSSSNYIEKMSNFKKFTGNMIEVNNKSYYWNEIWDALYYSFIERNKIMLSKNYFIARNVAHWNKKSKNEKKYLLKLAKDYLETYI